MAEQGADVLKAEQGVDMLNRDADQRLYNVDLAPIPHNKRTWGAFEIFNVWANDVQSLFGYTLAATMFVSYGLNGWVVFTAITLSSLFVMWLVNLAGKPSVKYGIPGPVFARVSMGIWGANFPTMLRSITALFWYGAQTYLASTAIALVFYAATGGSREAIFLGMSAIDWISFIVAWGFQIIIFWRGMDFIAKFLNWAGPIIYLIMVILTIALWSMAGKGFLEEVGRVFRGTGNYTGTGLDAFMKITGTMIAYFAAVVINFGDFSRFLKSRKSLHRGNLYGLPGNTAFFSLIALLVTGGTAVVFGEVIIDPMKMVELVGFLPLTIVAALMFFAATVGINLVANFVPPVYGLTNLFPRKIHFRSASLIVAGLTFILGALWVSSISQFGLDKFVGTLGAVLAPLYGIMICDYYLIKHAKIRLHDLYSADHDGCYYYSHGWNLKAMWAFVPASVFSVLTVWLPELAFLEGFAWVLGAFLGGLVYGWLMWPKDEEIDEEWMI